MGVSWTEEQQKVIDTRNCNILVSAAAGSGKTAVLVERIIQRITDKNNPVDIDELLIVTLSLIHIWVHHHLFDGDFYVFL